MKDTLLHDPLQAFALKVARLRTDEEMDGDMSGDHACSVLSELVEEARALTRNDENAKRRSGGDIIVRTSNGYAEIVRTLTAVKTFLEMLGDCTDNADAIDLLTNHLEDVEHCVTLALKKAGESA